MPKSRKGALYQKLFYRKYHRKRKDENTNNLNDEVLSHSNEDVSTIVDEFHKLTVDEESQYLAYFKVCIVKRDLDILKIKLKQSIELREKTIRKRETKFVESFPFYFVEPSLVIIFILPSNISMNIM